MFWVKFILFAWKCYQFGQGENFVAWQKVNSVPNNEILDWSKLIAFADDKVNVNKKFKFVLGRLENNVGKGENAGYQHFLLFPQCFPKVSFSRLLELGIVW